MKRSSAVAAGFLVALLVAGTVSAGPLYTGATDLLDPPVAGTTVDVDVSITSVGPVVAYEFQIQNECQLPNKGARTVQRDDIVYWTFHEDGVPHATMPVNLQSIPAGSKCKVFLTRGNVQVKGSVTSYTIQAAP